MAQLFPPLPPNNHSIVHAMIGVSPDLIARYQSLQTFFNTATFDNNRHSDVQFVAEMQSLAEELATSFRASVDRVKADIDTNTSINGSRKVKDGSALKLIGSAQQVQEKKLLFESRVLTAVTAVCGQYDEVAKAVMAGDNKANGDLIDAIIAVLVEIAKSVCPRLKL